MSKSIASGYILKFVVPLALSGALFFILVFLVFLPRYEASLLAKERQQLKELTNMAYSVTDQFHQMVDRGEMSKEEAQTRAANALRAFRYGIGGQNYFWLMRTGSGQGLEFIMHPVRPELLGTRADTLPDADGKKFMADLETKVQRNGCHSFDYQWLKTPANKRASPKTAYSLWFEPWGWVISSTVYLDDIQDAITRMSRNLAAISAFFLAAMVGLAALTVWQGKRNETELDKHRSHLEELVASRTEQLNQSNTKLQDEVEEHRRLENDIKQILNASGDALCVIALDFDILYANQSYADLARLPLDGIIGHKCHEVFPEENCGTPNCYLTTTLARNQRLEADIVKRHADGSPAPCILTSAPYLDAGGKTIGVVQTLKDITERNRVQEMENFGALQRGRIEVSNNILHDIGNAITSVGTGLVRVMAEKDWEEVDALARLSQLLAKDMPQLQAALGERKAQSLRSFVDATLAMSRRRHNTCQGYFDKTTRSITHINAILNIQRHYAREIRQAYGKVDLGKLLDDAFLMQSDSLEKRGVHVVYDRPAQPQVVSGDQTRLVQVILNLLRNACEAFDSCPAQVERSLTAAIKDLPGGGVELTLRDNACGFEPELAERLFERGVSRKPDSLGIGLHECREIIESHHGSIRLESQGIGQGAVVTVTLPS